MGKFYAIAVGSPCAEFFVENDTGLAMRLRMASLFYEWEVLNMYPPSTRLARKRRTSELSCASVAPGNWLPLV